jgi:hypothetical protein
LTMCFQTPAQSILCPQSPKLSRFGHFDNKVTDFLPRDWSTFDLHYGADFSNRFFDSRSRLTSSWAKQGFPTEHESTSILHDRFLSHLAAEPHPTNDGFNHSDFRIEAHSQRLSGS